MLANDAGLRLQFALLKRKADQPAHFFREFCQHASTPGGEIHFRRKLDLLANSAVPPDPAKLWVHSCHSGYLCFLKQERLFTTELRSLIHSWQTAKPNNFSRLIRLKSRTCSTRGTGNQLGSEEHSGIGKLDRWSYNTNTPLPQHPLCYCTCSCLVCGSDNCICLTEANTPYLFVKSLKQRRSLLWCLKSFGSLGISDKKTCATSNGPFKSRRKKSKFLETICHIQLLRNFSHTETFVKCNISLQNASWRIAAGKSGINHQTSRQLNLFYLFCGFFKNKTVFGKQCEKMHRFYICFLL